jgi:hypothetical protein
MISADYLRELIDTFVLPPHNYFQRGQLDMLKQLLAVAEAQL